jgi:hypothetical protein
MGPQPTGVPKLTVDRVGALHARLPAWADEVEAAGR